MTQHSADLIINLDDEPAAIPRRTLRRRFHPTTTTVLTGSAAAIVLAYALMSGSIVTGHRPHSTQNQPVTSALPPPEPDPRLIVPDGAAAGDTLIVLAYRNPRLCGGAELRFDGATIRTTTIQHTAPKNHASPRIFLSMRIPSTAVIGRHKIELFGPMPSVGGVVCGDFPERQRRVATADIVIHQPGAAR